MLQLLKRKTEQQLVAEIHAEFDKEVLNYEMKKRGYGQESKGDYYPESSGPYEDDQSSFFIDIGEYRLAQFENKKDPKKDPKFFMNFLNFEF